QPRALPPAPRTRQRVKPLKNPLPRKLRNPRSAILHHHSNLAAPPHVIPPLPRIQSLPASALRTASTTLDLHHDDPALRRKLNRVLQEVHHRLHQQKPLATHPRLHPR